MRYLKLSCDLHYEDCLKDQYRELGEIDLQLSDHLLNSLKDWHRRYQLIIPVPRGHRNNLNKLILQLDEEGIELAKTIAKEIKGEVKIQYFSEGLLKNLHPTIS